MFLEILQYIVIVLTIIVGLVSLIAPRKIEGFTGIKDTGSRSIVEIRTIFGAVFIGLGLAAFLLDPTVSYPMLGIVNISMAVTRLASMFLDRNFEASNLISLASETSFGIIMVL